MPQNERRADKTSWTKWWEEIFEFNSLSLPTWILFWFLIASNRTSSRFQVTYYFSILKFFQNSDRSKCTTFLSWGRWNLYF